MVKMKLTLISLPVCKLIDDYEKWTNEFLFDKSKRGLFACNFVINLLFLEISKVTDTKNEPVQDMIGNWQFIFLGK